MLDSALTALAQNGPLALLAGMIVIVLWKKLTALQVHYGGDPKDPTKVGLIAANAAAAQAREDKLNEEAKAREDTLRVHYETRLDSERSAAREVMNDFNATLRGIADG